MKRIGIVTFHCSYNFGSALQTYALKKVLDNFNNRVNIIHYINNKNFEQYKLFRTWLYPINPKSLIADIFFFFHNYKRKTAFENFWKKYFNLTKEYHDCDSMRELNKDFDCFICGSDQIWNLDCTEGVIPAYFLGFASDDKLKIACAPGISHTKFKKNYDDELKKYLPRFDAVSIREKSTVNMYQPFVDRKIVVTVDPTLLLTSDDYVDIYNEGNVAVSNGYIFLYILEKNNNIISYAEELARKENKSIVFVSQKPYFLKAKSRNVYGCGPSDFLAYIKNADYIVTNSFHATVFSVLFHKQFCTFATINSGSRMVDLLGELGLSKCLYHDDIDINQTIDYPMVELKLEQMRASSINFLRSTLGE